jgi:micrococcal nuclease
MLDIRCSSIARSLVAVLVVVGCTQPANSAVDIGTVVEVIDGDTVDLSIAGHRQRVRLIGIDTPETKHPSKPVQCYGPEATKFTESLLAHGTEVRIERDAEARDTYDRLLVYLYRTSDNTFINLELVLQGFAHVLTIEPNIAYMDKFVAASRDAQSNNRGLWQACRG